MYIRRKVFSVAYDENGNERLFSTTEILNEGAYVERLYARAVKTPEVLRNQEIGRQTAAKIQGEKGFQKKLEEIVKAGEGKSARTKAGRAAAKASAELEKRANNIENIKNTAKAKSQKVANKAAADAKYVGGGSYKAVGKNAKKAIMKSNLKNALTSKTAKGIGLGLGAASALGAAGYGGYRVAANKRED